MAVYAEYLFLENFITGLLLLYFTARLTGTCVGGASRTGRGGAKISRLIAGAALSGCSAFILFLPLNMAEAYLLRGISALLICLAGLGRNALLKKTGVFIILSFLSGGAAMALFLWQQIPALSGNGILYMESMTYVSLICCGVPAMAGVSWFIRLVKKQRRIDWTCGEAELELDGKICRLRALVDSGNSLKDPITGRPVILIGEKGAGMLPFRKEDYEDRFAAVPYRAVGTDAGILTGVRLDRMTYEGKQVEKPVLAFYGGNFQGFEILLNRDILEEGVLEHAESKHRKSERPGQEILPESTAAEAEETAGGSVLHRRK